MSNLKYIAPLVEKEIANGDIVGANVSAWQNGKKLYFESFGMADREKKIKMQKNTIFRMFSVTKIVTSVATMILFERGMIDLYEPIEKFLPGFKNQKVATQNGLVPVKRKMIIKDLLNMVSGLPYAGENNLSDISMAKMLDKLSCDVKNGKYVNKVEFYNQIGQLPLYYHPGEKFLYGESADVLGAVIEVITGKRYGQFLEDEIFKPLGMNDTGFFVPDEKRNRLAQIYKYNENMELEIYEDCYNFGLNSKYGKTLFESAGAGLFSTMEDFSKFAMMLANKGKYNDTRILGRKTVEFMARNNLTQSQMETYNWESTRGYGYGNLLRVMLRQDEAAANTSIGEFGWDGWVGTYVSIDPSENLTFLYFIQRCDAGTTELTRKIRSIVYSSIDA